MWQGLNLLPFDYQLSLLPTRIHKQINASEANIGMHCNLSETHKVSDVKHCSAMSRYQSKQKQK